MRLALIHSIIEQNGWDLMEVIGIRGNAIQNHFQLETFIGKTPQCLSSETSLAWLTFNERLPHFFFLFLRLCTH